MNENLQAGGGGGVGETGLTQAEEGEVVLGVLVLHAGPLHGLAYDVVHHLDGTPLPEDDLLHRGTVWHPCTQPASMLSDWNTASHYAYARSQLLLLSSARSNSQADCTTRCEQLQKEADPRLHKAK